MRARVSDLQNSRVPQVLGVCRDDLPRLLSYANEATQRLLNNATEGWYGGFHKAVFRVKRDDPYITLPAQYQSILNLASCRPMPMRNMFYEYLETGTGPLPNPNGQGGGRCAWGNLNWCLPQQSFMRDSVCVQRDLDPVNQLLRVYITDPRDIGFKLLISQATDSNGVGIYTTDVNQPVNGFLMTLAQPFVTSEMIFTSFQNVGKSQTYGDVLLKQVDATTGEEILLARYTPYETNPSYRRYYMRSLPLGCCAASGETEDKGVLVTAICKVQYSPVSAPTDYLLIANIPALKEECESIRFGEIDSAEAQQKSLLKHQNAIRLLNQEMVAETGQDFSVKLAPYGHAALWKQKIGYIL